MPRTPRAPLPRAASVLVAAVLLVPAFALVETLEVANRQQLEGQPVSGLSIFGHLLLPWALLSLCVPLMQPVVARAPLALPLRWRPLALHVAAALLLPLVHVSLMAVLYSAVWGLPVRERFEWLFSAAYRADVLVFCATAATLYAIRFTRERRLLAEEALHLRAELSEARLAALQSQLQPHFFFNALNSVAALVRAGRASAAVDALARLSHLIRETLRERDLDDVSLDEEFGVLREYLDIERLRFGDRLRVHFALDPAVAEARVPFLLLQPLAENAVRHGVSGRPGPSELRVSAAVEADALRISISEQGGGGVTGGAEGGMGMGLRNTRERLARRFGAAATLDLVVEPDGRGSQARLTLPLTRGAAGGDTPVAEPDRLALT